MSVFYRGPKVLITNEAFEVARSGHRRYAVEDLTAVHIVRNDPDGSPVGQRVLGLSALVSVFLVVPVVGRASAILAVVAVLGLLLYTAVSLRTMPKARWDLVAIYQGNLTTLFTTIDQREFEQVCRGLQRCLEHRDAAH
jgi:uncharacterized protein DUF6232